MVEVSSVFGNGISVFFSQEGDTVSMLFAEMSQSGAFACGLDGVQVGFSCLSSSNAVLQQKVVPLLLCVQSSSALGIVNLVVMYETVVSLFTEESEMLLACHVSSVLDVIVVFLFGDVTEQDSSSACGVGFLFDDVPVEGFFLEESGVLQGGEVAEDSSVVGFGEGFVAF